MDIEGISLIGVGVIMLVVAVAMLAGRIGIAAPLILVVVGIVIGYLPWVPLISVDPEVILLAVLPPILYAAAVNVPVVDLRRNFGPIASLSVVLVVVSALAIGFLVHWIVPEIPLAAAIALGAVVAPTDAVAATSIGKRVGMPPRLVTILEGESLVNDATSLVLLRTAIAATAGSFFFWDAVGEFVYAVVIAIAIGLVVGIITVALRAKIQNPVYDTIISFAVPFISFVPTEYLGGSGVLAVVTTGLYSGHHAAKRFNVRARISERLNWRTIQFLLENGVFLLMGLELHQLIVAVQGTRLQIEHTLFLAIGITVALIILRLLFMAPVTWMISRSLRRWESRATTARNQADRLRRSNGGAHTAVIPRPGVKPADSHHDATGVHQRRLRRLERLERRTAANASHAREQGIGWRGATIVGWSGMRGVVTLAAAQSIPTSVPYRSQLVLIAFAVAVLTLLIHGLSLPSLIRKLRPAGPTKRDQAEELTGLYNELVIAGQTALDTLVEQDRAHAAAHPGTTPLSDSVVRHVRATIRSSMAQLAFAYSEPAESDSQRHDAEAYLRLTRAVVDAQRAALLEERAVGQYSSEALQTVETALDAHELRLSSGG